MTGWQEEPKRRMEGICNEADQILKENHYQFQRRREGSQHLHFQRQSETSAGGVCSQVSGAVQAEMQHRRGECDLCDG